MQTMESAFREPSQLAEGREQPEVSGNRKASQTSSTAVQPSTCSSDSDSDLGGLGSKFRRLAEQNKRLQEELVQLEEEIHEYRSDLTALRFPDQCSDESIQKTLEEIHRAIDDWVFEALSRSEENALYRLCQKQYQAQRQQKGRSRFSKKFISKSWEWNLGPYPCSDHFVLSMVIQWILDEEIFRRRYPLVLSEPQRSFLEEVEHALKHALTIKERLNIDRWSSETLRVLVALPNTATLQEKVQKEVAERTRRTLSFWVPDPGMFSKLEGRLKRDILYPAIKLHQDIRVSSHQYYLDPQSLHRDKTPEDMLDRYQMKSIHDWGPVKRINQIGEVLGCLHPALIRLRNDGETYSILSRAVIVVARPENETRTAQQGRSEKAIVISEPAIKELQSTPLHTGVEPQEDGESIDDRSGSESSDLESATRRPIFDSEIPAGDTRRMRTWPTSLEARSSAHRVYRIEHDAPTPSMKEQEAKQGYREGDFNIRVISPDRGGIGHNEHLSSTVPSNYPRKESVKDSRSRDQSVRGKSVASDEKSPQRSPALQKESSSKTMGIYSKSKATIVTKFLGPQRTPPSSS